VFWEQWGMGVFYSNNLSGGGEKMRSGGRIMVLAITMITMTASASEWVLVSTSETQTISIDVQSIVKQGKKLKVWDLTEYTAPQSSTADPSQKYLSSKNLWLLDCAQKTITVIQSVDYSGPIGTDNVVESYVFDPSIPKYKERDVVPDSVGEKIVNAACKYATGNARPSK
jgi:hypothetical protein